MTALRLAPDLNPLEKNAIEAIKAKAQTGEPLFRFPSSQPV
jgi:hypothetical protein